MVGVQRPAVQSPVHHLDGTVHTYIILIPNCRGWHKRCNVHILLGHMCCKHPVGVTCYWYVTMAGNIRLWYPKCQYDDQCLLCCSSSMTLCTAKG
jgi:hypothetical protein